MRRLKRQRPVYRAQTLVEFALILPLLLIVTMLIIQYGLIMYTSNSITNLSREGARFAAIAPAKDQPIKDHIKDVMPPSINYSDIAKNINIEPKETSSARSADNPSGGGGLISVTISYPMSKKLFLPSTFFGIHIFNQTFTATTQMVVEN